MERKLKLTLDEAETSEGQALVRQKLVESYLLHYKIGETYWQEDYFGRKDGVPKRYQSGGLSCHITGKDLGLKKICKRCKKEFFTGTNRSRVLCQDCKTEMKNRPDHYEKICPICNQPFTSKRSDAQTCHKESCRKALYRQKKRSNS
jgi:hypothetical protein